MQLPQKSQKGAVLRTWLVETVDRLIDCVTAMRLRPGPGISLKETPCGTIVSVSTENGRPKTSPAPAAMGKAGQGIRIDNGMASSFVPAGGGTASAVPLHGATFTCLVSGGTPGVNAFDYPDYIALSTIPSGSTVSTPNGGPGIGITLTYRIHSGVTFSYSVPSGLDCLGVFAAAVEGSESSMGVASYLIESDEKYVFDENGYLRLSILDDGCYSGQCIRLFVGTDNWEEALPIYRCGTFVSGITSSVSGGTACVTLQGGTGSVRVVGNGVKISENANGEIVLSLAGSTSGGGNAVFIFGQTIYQPEPNSDVFIGTLCDAAETQNRYQNLFSGLGNYQIIPGYFVQISGASWSNIESLDYSKMNDYEGGNTQYESYYNAWMNREPYCFSVGILLPTNPTKDCFINLHVGKLSYTMVFCQDSSSRIINVESSSAMQFLNPIYGGCSVTLFYDHSRNVWYATEIS